MPKLIYFPVQGRAQGLRYMLAAKGVEFEDVRITGAEWGPMKESQKYGAGAQLPVWERDDGTFMTQSLAMLKSLAMDLGYAPSDSKTLFETEWFYALGFDVFEKPERFAILKDDATEEAQDACIKILDTLMDRLESRFSDGRTTVGGSQTTHADFYLLSVVTSHYENPNGKHEKIRNAGAAKVKACPNVERVLAPMRELCKATIDALPASSI